MGNTLPKQGFRTADLKTPHFRTSLAGGGRQVLILLSNDSIWFWGLHLVGKNAFVRGPPSHPKGLRCQEAGRGRQVCPAAPRRELPLPSNRQARGFSRCHPVPGTAGYVQGKPPSSGGGGAWCERSAQGLCSTLAWCVASVENAPEGPGGAI